MKKLALIDGYGFVFRAYHSLPPLTRPDGTPVGAVYGFTNMLIKLLASLDVSHAAVVFDSGSKTFRNEIFPAYKANRPPCPEDLKPQFAIVREAAESLNLAILEKTGFEADDIIATIAKKSAAQGFEVLIVSSDKDLMQLIGERIAMYDAMKNKLIGEAQVREKFFVPPQKVLDVLSLIGDSSDNIPGVKGIGPKTAAELIEQFGSLEEIFSNLDAIKQDKRRELLRVGEENAKLSKILAALCEDVEVGIEISDLEVKSIDPYKLISFLDQQGFRSLVARVKKEFQIEGNLSAHSNTEDVQSIKISAEKKSENLSFNSIKKTKITNLETFDEIKKQALLNGIVTIDSCANLITISTSKINEKPTEIFYFKLKEEKEIQQTTDLFNQPPAQETEGFSTEPLTSILTHNSIQKILLNSKISSLTIRLRSSSYAGQAYHYLDLIHHLLTSATKTSLRELIDLNLDEDIETRGFGEMFEAKEFADEEKKIEFATFRNFAIHQLWQIFYPKIFSEKLNTAYHSYELPTLDVLRQMEDAGIEIDAQKLRQLSSEFAKKISDLSNEIYAITGEEFNIASTQQLGKILFEKLGLQSSKKSKKTGALSTGVGVLEELEEQGHPIARKILEFRKFSKLKNTYTDALPKEINPKTGRVHTSFSSTSTITGRLSSSAPNLQNIPIKTFEGRKIREAFVAKKDHLLICADYSQIELRVIAHVAHIDSLITAFKAGNDIHKITAAQVFKIPEEQVDENLRSKAKAINFGIIYGISAFGLARQLGISRQDAANYIKSYLETYPGIDSYMQKTIDSARRNGFVQTLSGRKCFIHDINNKNPFLRSEAERLSINAPIQGSAADIVKKAMIRLSEKFSAEKMAAKIILQIHDELIIEAPKGEVELAAKITKSEMENAAMLDLPLTVDIKIDSYWK